MGAIVARFDGCAGGCGRIVRLSARGRCDAGKSTHPPIGHTGPVNSVAVDTGWTFAPVLLLTLVVYAVVYVVRWRKVRATHGARAAGGGRIALWFTGLGLIVVALMSPLDRIGEQLASAHMVQHLILADLVPIAMILALTKVLLRPVTRQVNAIEKRAGWFGHPAAGLVAYVGFMWFWHIPVLYDAALDNAYVHVIEHLTFAASGFLYWWHLISPIRSRLRLGGMAPIAYMATTKLLVGALGIFLAFYPKLLYDGYAINGERWGMSPVDDQHVAGLIMGLEQSLVMGIGLAYLFARMLRESEEADLRAERLEERAA
jgi:putative membrane protein